MIKFFAGISSSRYIIRSRNIYTRLGIFDVKSQNLEEYVQTHSGSFTLYFVWANSPAIFHEN